MTGLIVRRITAAEYRLAVELFDKYRIFYKQLPDKDLAEKFIKKRLDNNESVIYIAFISDIPVGFTQLYPKYSSMRAVKNWILNDLYVDENYRKQGIGKKLIDAAMGFAKEEKAKFVQLETAADNYTAQQLYESIGFIKQIPDTEFIMYRINVD